MMSPRRWGRAPFALAWVLLAWMAIGCGGGSKPPTPDIAGTPWEVSVESPLGEGAAEEDTGDVADSALAAGETPAVETPATGDAPAAGEAPAAAAAPASETPAAADGAAAPAPGTAPAAPVPDPADFTKGWRVQIAALSTLADADARAREARARFTEPVYVEYEPPFYKVRVGDFLTRAQAESMATRARAERYEGAWVVETLVLRPVR